MHESYNYLRETASACTTVLLNPACALKLAFFNHRYFIILLDFSLTVKAAPHECVIRTSQP